MPYAVDYIGIYKIVNNATGKCYVGQSQRVKKRVKEHFRLLNINSHPNPHLQNSYNKYGKEVFTWALEVECEDAEELDVIEEAFLLKKAWFEEEMAYNIANFSKAPMRGKKHTEETRQKIREAKLRSNFDYENPAWRDSLKKGQLNRVFSNKEHVANIRYIIDNPNMTYAERGRQIGKSTSCTRRLYLKYNHLKGLI